MPLNHKVDTQEGIVYVTWTGKVTAEDLSDFAKTIPSDREVAACSKSITDMSDCEISFTWQQLHGPAEALFGAAAKRGKRWKTAIVVKQSVQLGVARQHALLTGSLKDTEVFYSLAEARRWLLGNESASKEG